MYKYKLERLAENDFDERLKLARWCLGQDMEAEAREQLTAILELDPKISKPRRCWIRSTRRRCDWRCASFATRGVQQTAAEQLSARRWKTGPAPVDASVIYGAKSKTNRNQ